MSNWTDIGLPAATFLGGTGTTSFFGWLRARKRQPSENLRNEVEAAKGVNDMVLASLKSLSERLAVVELAQESAVKELDRVTALFREAIGALRSVIEATRQGRVPEIFLSPELMQEMREGL